MVTLRSPVRIPTAQLGVFLQLITFLPILNRGQSCLQKILNSIFAVYHWLILRKSGMTDKISLKKQPVTS